MFALVVVLYGIYKFHSYAAAEGGRRQPFPCAAVVAVNHSLVHSVTITMADGAKEPLDCGEGGRQALFDHAISHEDSVKVSIECNLTVTSGDVHQCVCKHYYNSNKQIMTVTSGDVQA